MHTVGVTKSPPEQVYPGVGPKQSIIQPPKAPSSHNSNSVASTIPFPQLYVRVKAKNGYTSVKIGDNGVKDGAGAAVKGIAGGITNVVLMSPGY